MHVPEFTAGERPMASDFCALVAAVRALWHAPLPQPPVRRTARRWRYFCVSGTAIARLQVDGSISAQVAEDLSTLDGKAERVQGGEVSGIERVMKKNPDAIIGLHAGSEGAPCECVAWVRDEAWDGTIEEGCGLYHGGRICGAVLPADGVRGQKQRLPRMWWMPQRPLYLAVERRFAVTGLQGCLALLPSDDFRQRLTHGCWYYAPGDAGGSVGAQPYGFFGKLDKWGQLQIKFKQG